ncbi:hypothetical protein [Parasitella parasitica]|uniref:Uncharacterized protein n=1 Tax=Parasitella parasitica TaxID=35722 RepID=A0A0B7MXR9_9FUNG|nr:hypothetical protein [Parasitella parasitica]
MAQTFDCNVAFELVKVFSDFGYPTKLSIDKVEGAGHRWDLFTPGIQLALNNKVSKRLNSPPFNLMFARKMNAFLDQRKSDKAKKNSFMIYDQLINRINVISEFLIPAIMDETNTYVDNMKNKYDKYKSSVNDFEKDTPVMYAKQKVDLMFLLMKLGLLMDRDYAPSELKVISQYIWNDEDVGKLNRRNLGP